MHGNIRCQCQLHVDAGKRMKCYFAACSAQGRGARKVGREGKCSARGVAVCNAVLYV